MGGEDESCLERCTRVVHTRTGFGNTLLRTSIPNGQLTFACLLSTFVRRFRCFWRWPSRFQGIVGLVYDGAETATASEMKGCSVRQSCERNRYCRYSSQQRLTSLGSTLPATFPLPHPALTSCPPFTDFVLVIEQAERDWKRKESLPSALGDSGDEPPMRNEMAQILRHSDEVAPVSVRRLSNRAEGLD